MFSHIDNMQYRQLGSTGIAVSEIGFGAWGIGGTVNGSVAYGATDDLESQRALRQAYEDGVTLYDTADFYGYGHSESLIGKTFKDVRHKIVLASKVGFIRPELPQDFSPNHLRYSLEGSLRRLLTDYVDLYQLHSPSIGTFIGNEEILQTLHDFVREGKVRVIGIAASSPDEALIAVRQFAFKAVQANFSLVDQRGVKNGLLDLCEEKGVGVIARTPLCFGFLAGKYGEGYPFGDGDHRSLLSTAQTEKWEEARKLFYNSFEERERQSSAQLALRYCLSYPAVSSVIPGMLKVEEVLENTMASRQGPLSKRERETMEQIYRDHVFFLGKYTSLKEKSL